MVKRQTRDNIRKLKLRVKILHSVRKSTILGIENNNTILEITFKNKKSKDSSFFKSDLKPIVFEHQGQNPPVPFNKYTEITWNCCHPAFSNYNPFKETYTTRQLYSSCVHTNLNHIALVYFLNVCN